MLTMSHYKNYRYDYIDKIFYILQKIVDCPILFSNKKL